MSKVILTILCLNAFVACYGLASSPTLAGSYRKDYYLKNYHESLKSYTTPTDGGRVHLVLQGSTCNLESVKSVMINSQEAMNLPSGNTDLDDPDFSYFDWSRFHADTQSNVFWISFHSRNKDWLDSSDTPTLQVSVTDDKSQCYSGSVQLNVNPAVTVTYATTANSGLDFIVHFSGSGTLSSYMINGVLISNKPITVSGNQTKIVNFKQSISMAPGRVWSVVYGSVGYGGRVIPEFFPIEAWPYSKDCPVPGTQTPNPKDYETVKDLGIDTIFLSTDACGDPAFAADSLAQKNLPMTLMLKPKFLQRTKNHSKVSAIYIGDEVDGDMNDNLRNPIPKSMNDAYPEIPTYQGGKTNSHIGSYSGITDIQGMDAYLGACAPTIVPVIKPLPIDYPYLYLKNTRNNHMPLPTWLYSQMYSGAWSYQANANEIVAQIAQTVLAGAKGITLFQSKQDEFDQHDLKPIKQILNSIQGVKEHIRIGSIGGAKIKSSGEPIMYEAIRTPNKLVLVVLNTKAHGYSNLICHIYIAGKHWNFEGQKVEKLELEIPDGMTLSNFTEQIGSDTVTKPDGVQVEINGNSVKLKDMELDSKNVARIFTFDVAE